MKYLAIIILTLQGCATINVGKCVEVRDMFGNTKVVCSEETQDDYKINRQIHRGDF